MLLPNAAESEQSDTCHLSFTIKSDRSFAVDCITMVGICFRLLVVLVIHWSYEQHSVAIIAVYFGSILNKMS